MSLISGFSNSVVNEDSTFSQGSLRKKRGEEYVKDTDLIEVGEKKRCLHPLGYKVVSTRTQEILKPQFKSVFCEEEEAIKTCPKKLQEINIKAFEAFLVYSEGVSSLSGVPSHLTVAFINKFIGNGLFLKTDAQRLRKNQFVGIYTGMKKNVNEDKEVVKDNGYVFQLYQNASFSVIVDGAKKGNFTRYINHSFYPNCYGRLVRLSTGQVEMAIFTQSMIQPGEQLLIDYGIEYWHLKKIAYPFEIRVNTFLLTASSIVQKQDSLEVEMGNSFNLIEEELLYQLKKAKIGIDFHTKEHNVFKEIEKFLRHPNKISSQLYFVYNKKLNNKLVYLSEKASPIKEGEVIGVYQGCFARMTKAAAEALQEGFILQKDRGHALVLSQADFNHFTGSIVHSEDPNTQAYFYDISAIKEAKQLNPLLSDIQVIYKAIKTINPGEVLTTYYGKEFSADNPSLAAIDWDLVKGLN